LNAQRKIVDIALQGDKLYTLSQGGEISLWDLRMRDIVCSVLDDGNYKPTMIRASPDEKYFATGSYSGIVNLYNSKVFSSESKPQTSFDNLTTAINVISFNHNSEIIAFGSKWKPNAFRLAHINSHNVY